MILSDEEIRLAVESGEIGIDPLPDYGTQLQPSSLDLTLGSTFSVFKNPTAKVNNLEEVMDGSIKRRLQPHFIDTRETDVGSVMEVHRDFPYLNIKPGSFVLAHTVERVRIPNNLVGVVDGRSSFGRLGVMVHVTAGYIDPGFEGQITLELKNVGPAVVRLHVGDRVCQIRFHRMSKPALNPYSGKYQGDEGAVASRINRDNKRR
jgi:dCTP deaminase